MGQLPGDPVILLSFVNTKLRDEYPSLEEFCQGEGADQKNLVEKMQAYGYHYQKENNRFGEEKIV